MKGENINIFLNSRKFTAMIWCVVIVAIVLNYNFGVPQSTNYSYGLCFPSSNLWISNSLLSLIINFVGIFGIATLLLGLNRKYNFIKGDSWLFISLTPFLISCLPKLTIALHDGTLFCVLVLVMVFLLFSLYYSPHVTRRIYLIFTLITGAGLFQYAYLSLIPVFIIGMIQMHAFSFKGVIAIILGIITPFWAFMGMGIIGIDDFVLPSFLGYFDNKEWQLITILVVYVGGLIAIGVLLLCLNIIKIYNFKLKQRAYNGFFSILLLYLIFMMIIDYNNMFVYLPLFVCCVSIQIGHSFSFFMHRYRYIPLLLFMITYTSLYLARILL